MLFAHVDRSRIELDWAAIAEVLAPAVRVHVGATMQGIYDQLMSGALHLIECSSPEAQGLLAIHVFEENEGISCFASYIAGRFTHPRQMLRNMRSIMAEFETHCRDAGVRQIYIGGRDWRRVFPDYSPADDVPGRLRKVL